MSSQFSVFALSFFVVVRREGKGSRPHVFSLVPSASMPVGPILDVAANSQEELKEWIMKIREVAMTSEAKVYSYVIQLRAVSGQDFHHATLWVQGQSDLVFGQ